MSMISEQVKQLRLIAEEYGKPPYGMEVRGTVEALCKAADTIETLSAKLAKENNGGWILCSDMLPKPNQIVLATENEEVVFCCYEYFEGYGYGFYGSNGNVIAWQPLPEPYKPQ